MGHTSPRSQPNEQAAFRKWIKETFEVPALPVESGTGWIYAKFKRSLVDKFDKKRGKYTENREDGFGNRVGVDENDLWLVAQAKEHTLTFVTIDKMNRINQVVGSEVTIETWPEK